MKIIDLKYQSVTPGNPSPNTLGIYADSGSTNVVYSLTSGGVPRLIGSTVTGSIPTVSVASGQGVLDTGVFIGSTGVGTQRATGLSIPFRWIPVFDTNGAVLAVPAYQLA